MELATLEDLDTANNFFAILNANVQLFDDVHASVGAKACSGASTIDWWWIKQGTATRTNFPMRWNKGEPNNAGNYEYCLQVAKCAPDGGFGFNDVACNRGYQENFICQEF